MTNWPVPAKPDSAAPLIAAANEGDNDALRRLIEKGADVNVSQPSDGTTALIVAAAFGHLRVVETLLSAKADPNKPNAQGRVPLGAAAEGGHNHIVQLLLRSGAVVDQPSRIGDTPLFLAALRGQWEPFKTLLAAGADPRRVTPTHNTALIMAAQGAALPDAKGDHLAILKKLLEAGCPLDSAVLDTGVTAFIVGCASGKPEIVDTLLAAKCDPFHKMKNGSSALMAAVQGGNEKIVSSLLGLGVDPNACLDNGSGPLLLAIERGLPDVVTLLLDRGADCNHGRDDGLTPVIFATIKGMTAVVKKMLAQGADMRSATPQGGTPLVLASEYGHNELVSLLLQEEKIAGTNSADTALVAAVSQGRTEVVRLLLQSGRVRDTETPFHIATRNRVAGVVDEMLKAGIFIDKPGKDAQTPLFAACSKGFFDVANLLLERGADPKFRKAADGITVLMAVCLLPAQLQPAPMVKQLLKKGADPNVVSTDGRNSTALCFAILNEQLDTVAVLLEHGVDVNLGTPIVRAAQMGDVSLIKRLVAAGADPARARKEDKVHALVVAAYHGRVEAIDALLDLGPSAQLHEAFVTAAGANQMKVVERLLKAGANPNKPREEDEVSALMLASQMGDLAMVERLLEANADVQYRRPTNGANALLCACEAGRDAVSLRLLEAKADPNANSTDTGVSSLIRAAEAGQLPVVKALLDLGAEVDYQNKFGQSALMAAAFYQHEEIINYLLEKGAKTELACGKGPTALLMAIETGNAKIVTTLLEAKANILRRRVDNGQTALMIAAAHGNEEVALLLLMGTKAAVEKGGAKLRPLGVVDATKHSCLWHAVDNCHNRIAEVLFVTQVAAEAGEDVTLSVRDNGTLSYGPKVDEMVTAFVDRPPAELLPEVMRVDRSLTLPLAIRLAFCLYAVWAPHHLAEPTAFDRARESEPTKEQIAACKHECPLTMRKVVHPVAIADGSIFERDPILAHLQKHQHDPTQQFILNDRRVICIPYSLLS